MWEIAVALLVVLLAVIIYIGYTGMPGSDNGSCGCGNKGGCDRCQKSKCGGCDMPRRRCRCKKQGCQFC